MKAIFKRELWAYFTGPIGYIFIAIFLLLSNGHFAINTLLAYKSGFSEVFNFMTIVLIILIPLMTMRLWSEEKKQKTDQLLLTAPVSTTGVVLGKFFAALCVFLIALVPTLVYPAIVIWKGVLDTGVVIGNYVGIILVTSAYIAICIFISSLTKSQIISAIGGVLALALFFIADILVGVSSSAIVNTILSFFSMVTRYTNIYIGVLSIADLLYFVSLTVIFLFLTSRVIEKQRWS